MFLLFKYFNFLTILDMFETIVLFVISFICNPISTVKSVKRCRKHIPFLIKNAYLSVMMNAIVSISMNKRDKAAILINHISRFGKYNDNDLLFCEFRDWAEELSPSYKYQIKTYPKLRIIK